jgi:hypothetical protein
LGKDIGTECAVSQGNTRQWYLLYKGGYVTAEHFVCPADRRVKAKVPFVKTNWDFPVDAGGPTISYSFAMTKTNGASGVRLTPSDLDGIATIADHNGASSWSYESGAWKASPSGAVTQNSANHDRGGQNVFFLKGNGGWNESPNVGINDDNIWTGSGGSVEGVYPSKETDGSTKDSYLRP